ncbi:Phenolphthiocerol/phthiocerol polyketide synthase subunit A ((Phenol)carboxyphthiodiolenone synthase subunit A) (Beta-ketoacyl-acyl-carrier-protein synthase I) (Phthiocerol synthesis polyketide synthase type I PpsA), partial [Durusdinium trenchii]
DTDWPGVSAGFMEGNRAFQQSLADSAAIIGLELPRPLSTLLQTAGGGNGLSSTQRSLIVAAGQLALAETLRSYVGRPNLVVSYGSGEFVAACIAGAIDRSTMFDLVREHAEPGSEVGLRLIEVFAAEADVLKVIRQCAPSVKVVASDGASRAILAGESEELNWLAGALQQEGIQLRQIAGKWPGAAGSVTADIRLQRPSIAWLRPNIGGWFDQKTLAGEQGWQAGSADSLRIDALQSDLSVREIDTVVEIGIGGSVLFPKVAENAGDSAHWLSVFAGEEPGWSGLFKTLGRLYLGGATIDWPAVYQGCRKKEPAAATDEPTGMAYLEIACAAVNEVPNAEALAVRLFDFNWFDPVFVPGGGALLTRQVLEADGAAFQFLAMAAGLDAAGNRGEWKPQVRGRVELVAKVDAEWVDLAAAVSRCQREVTADEFYRELAQHGVNETGGYRAFEALRVGSGEATARLVGSGEASDQAWTLPPAVLQGAVNVLRAALADGSGELFDQKALWPVRLASTVVHRRLPEDLRCVARRIEGTSSGDVLLTDADGEMVVELRGLELGPCPRVPEGLVRSAASLSGVSTSGESANSAAEAQEEVSGSAQTLSDNVAPEWYCEAIWLPDEVTPQRVLPAGAWVVFCDEDGIGERLLSLLESHAQVAVRVTAGSDYRRESATRYVVSTEEADQFKRLLLHVQHDHGSLAGVVHLWNCQLGEVARPNELTLAESMTRGVHSLLYVSQALAELDQPEVGLWIASTDAQAIGENVPRMAPWHAPARAFARVASLEIPHVRATSVDFDGSEQPDQIAEALLRELQTVSSTNEIAYRNGQRFTPHIVNVDLDAVERRPSPRRRGGVCLIVGGHGGVGLELARELATWGDAKLVLVNRSAVGAAHPAETDKEKEQRLARAEAVRSLEAAGAGANHAAANLFQDAMAQYRRSRGRCATAINWGFWSDTGVVAQPRYRQSLAEKGVGQISNDEGRAAFEVALTLDKPQLGIANLDPETFIIGQPESTRRWCQVRDCASRVAGELIEPLREQMEPLRGLDEIIDPLCSTYVAQAFQALGLLSPDAAPRSVEAMADAAGVVREQRDLFADVVRMLVDDGYLVASEAGRFVVAERAGREEDYSQLVNQALERYPQAADMLRLLERCGKNLDRELRKTSPLLTAENWCSQLRECGFIRSIALPNAQMLEENLGHAMIVAQADHMEPRQALFLETAYRAIEQAGYAVTTDGINAFAANTTEPLELTAVQRSEVDVDPAEWLRRPEWIAKPAVGSDRLSPALRESGTWLVFADPSGLGQAVARQLQTFGQKVVLVSAGQGYACDGTQATIDPASAGDYERLLADALSGAQSLSGVVDCWSYGPSPSDRRDDSLTDAICANLNHLALLTKAVEKLGRTPWQLWMVTSEAASIPLRKRVIAEHASVWGFLRCLRLEYTNVTLGLIDLPFEEGAASRFVPRLMEEVAQGEAVEVAFDRDERRLVPTYTSLSHASAQGEPIRLRRGGVYLITGGLGGVGLQIAEQLANTPEVNLILLGRNPLPSEDSWDEWLATHEQNDEIANRIQAVRRMRARGANVQCIVGDVADLASLSGVMESIREQFGQLNGVVHAAGVLRDRLIHSLTPNDLQEVLQPKVTGAWALDQTTWSESLDFIVHFSSVAAAHGQVGQAAYAAANAYLDASVQQRRSNEGPQVMSLAWGPWAEFGMAAAHFTPEQWEQAGIEPITPAIGRQLFAAALEHAAPQWEIYKRTAKPKLAPPQVSTEVNVVGEIGATHPAPSTPHADSLDDADSKREFRKRLIEHLRDRFAATLGVASEELGPRVNFQELGLDSMLAVRLQRELERAAEIRLDVTVLFAYPTIDAFATHLLEEHSAAMAAMFAAESTSGGETTTVEESKAELNSEPSHPRVELKPALEKTQQPKDEASLVELVRRLQQAATERHENELAEHTLGDFCFSANVGRVPREHRLAITAADWEELIEKLTLAARGGSEDRSGVIAGHVDVDHSAVPVSLGMSLRKQIANLSSEAQAALARWCRGDRFDEAARIPRFKTSKAILRPAVSNKRLQANQDVLSWLHVPAWRENPLNRELSSIDRKTGTWLVFSNGSPLGNALVTRLREVTGRVVLVEQGPRYSRLGQDRFAINPENAGDYARLGEALLEESFDSLNVVHLWGSAAGTAEDLAAFDALDDQNALGEFQARLCDGPLSVARVVRHVLNPLGKVVHSLRLITAQAQDVDDTACLDPTASAMNGLLRVIARERHGLTCQVIDVDLDLEVTRNVENLVAEFFAGESDIEVAYRRGARYVPAVEDLSASEGSPDAQLEKGGVYLISGGLGGIGLAVARWLAEKWQAKLILVGRTELPPEAEWDKLLAEGSEQSVVKKIQAVLELRELGVQPMSTALGLAALERALSTHRAEVIVSNVDYGNPRTATPSVSKSDSIAKSAGQPSSFDEVEDWLLQLLGVALEEPAEDLSPERPFLELGVDSVIAADMARKVNEATGLSLPRTLCFDYATVRQLATALVHEHQVRLHGSDLEDTSASPTSDSQFDTASFEAASELQTEPSHEADGYVPGEGQVLKTGEKIDPEYWVSHARSTVQFAASVETLHAEGCRLLVEVGPQPTLLGMARRVKGQSNTVFIPSMTRGKGERRGMLEAAAQLYVQGATPEFAGLYRHERRRRVELPTYPFQRMVCAGAGLSPAAIVKPAGETLAQEVPSQQADAWLYERAWTEKPLPASSEAITGTWLIVGGPNELADEVAKRIGAEGASPVVAAFGDSFTGIGNGRCSISVADESDYQRMLESINDAESPLAGIIHLTGCEEASGVESTAAELEDRLQRSVFATFHLLKALAARGASDTTVRLVVLGKGGYATPYDSAAPSPLKAPLFTFARAAAEEFPDVQSRSIDVEVEASTENIVSTLLAELRAVSESSEVAYRGGRRLVPKIESFQATNREVNEPGTLCCSVAGERSTRTPLRQAILAARRSRNCGS